MSRAAQREVIVADAVEWLQAQPSVLAGCSFVTALPDVSETGTAFSTWTAWFSDVARRIVEHTPADGLAIFTQSDIRKDGVWVDKSFLVHEGARAAGGVLLARKVICRRPPGTTSSARAAFTHLLVYGRGRILDPALPDVVPDVLADPGPTTWKRGLGQKACEACLQMIQRHARATHTIVDPFCGEGMTLAVANAMGLSAVGVERHRKRAETARKLQLTLSPEHSG